MISLDLFDLSEGDESGEGEVGEIDEDSPFDSKENIEGWHDGYCGFLPKIEKTDSWLIPSAADREH